MSQWTGTIRPLPPFDFEITAGYHTYFQGRQGTDTMEDGVYRRLLDLRGKLVLASVSSAGTTDDPELALVLQAKDLSQKDVELSKARVSWLLGVDQELGPFYRLVRTDKVMSALVERFYGLHLPHTATVFEALVLAVLGQQISTGVARIIRTLLIETFGPSAEFDGETYYAFPGPEVIWASTPAELYTMKLTQRKSEYVHGLAGLALDDHLGLERLSGLTDQEILAKLTALRGVGSWTAQWTLIRAVGRPDALPLGDLALRRVVSQLYIDGAELTDTELEDIARRWSPYRSYATIYLFHALRMGSE